MSSIAAEKLFENKKFGKLTVISFSHTDKYRRKVWQCKCDCGNIVYISTNALKSGNTKSCGCLSKPINTLHNTRIYSIYYKMIIRCYAINDCHYKYYGGRGITVCDEWKNNFLSFYNWAVENGYRDDLSIDRINNDGNYESSNCRWSTKKEQANNRRSNIILEFNNEKHNIQEWSTITSISYGKLYSRYNSGKSIYEIFKEVV